MRRFSKYRRLGFSGFSLLQGLLLLFVSLSAARAEAPAPVRESGPVAHGERVPPDEPKPSTEEGAAPETAEARDDSSAQLNEALDKMSRKLGELQLAHDQSQELVEQVKGKLDKVARKQEEGMVAGWYSASISTQFMGQQPLNFSFNEIEMDMSAKASDWVQFEADMQVRPEAADPEESRSLPSEEFGESSFEEELESPARTLDKVVEQGFATFLLHRGTQLRLHTGKFNSGFGDEAYDTVDGKFLTHSMTFLHGVVKSLTGVKAGINIIDPLRIEIFAAEGWDINIDNNDMPALGGQVRLDIPNVLRASLSGYYGEETYRDPISGTTQADVPRLALSGSAALTAVKNLTVVLEGSFGTETVNRDGSELDNFWLSGYLSADYEPLSWLTIATRYELFIDDEGTRVPYLHAVAKGAILHGGYLAARLKLADRVFVAGEYNGRYASEKVLESPTGDVSHWDMFLGAQLFFRFGAVADDGKESLTHALTGSF